MSRSDQRSKKLRHRPSRIVPAVIVAAVITAAGVLTVISVIMRLVNDAWPAVVTTSATALAGLTWNSAIMISATVVIALLGLVLLIAGLKPGHATTARIATPGSPGIAETDYVISRRAVARLASAEADTVDGVERVSTTATGRRVRLSIVSPSEQTEEIRARVVAGVGRTLEGTGLNPVPRITASVRTKEI